MKRRRLLSLALALMLIISLCACKTKVVDDSTDATQGNAPVTGQKRDETTTAPQTAKAPQTTKAPENTTLAQRKTEKGKLDPNTGTYTGLSPLPKIKLTATDPQNTRGLQQRRSDTATAYPKTAFHIRTRQTRRNILTRRASTPSR